MAVTVDREKCNGCGNCVDVCPVQAITMTDMKAAINNDCVECGACVSLCPQGAITQSEAGK